MKFFKQRLTLIFHQTENGTFQGSLMGISIGAVTQAGTVTGTQKIWRSLQALGAMAFSYSFSIILIEIQVIKMMHIMIIYSFLYRMQNVT